MNSPAAKSGMGTPRRGRALFWLGVLTLLLSPWAWCAVRPHVLTRELWFDIDASTVGPRWTLDWRPEGPEVERRGLWLDLDDLSPTKFAVEIRPAGKAAGAKGPTPSFHLYDVRVGPGIYLTRADLKMLLAECTRNPEGMRARGVEFQGDWIAGIDSSGVIYQGSGPGLLKLTLPPVVATQGFVLSSERTIYGSWVDVSFAGNTTTVETLAEKWTPLAIEVRKARMPAPAMARVRVRLPSYHMQDLRLRCLAGPFGPSTFSPPYVRTAVFGVQLSADALPVEEFGRALSRRMLTREHRYWMGSEEIAAGVALAGRVYPGLAADLVGWVITATVLSALWVVVAIGVALSARLPSFGTVVPAGAASGSARAAFWVVFGAICCASVWMAVWAPVLHLSDSIDYLVNAEFLVERGSFDHFNAWRLPGVSVLLAPFVAWSSAPESLFTMVQAVAVPLAALMTYDIARRVMARGWAILAMAVVGLDPVTQGWSRHIMSEAPSLLIFTGAMWALVRAWGVDRGAVRSGLRVAGWSAAFGLFTAMGLLMRGNAQVLLVVGSAGLVVLLWTRGRRGRAVWAPALAVAVCLIAVLPWVVRVNEVYGRYATIIGRNYSRVVFGWRPGLIETNQQVLRAPVWRSVERARREGLDEYRFIAMVNAATPGTAGEHEWMTQEWMCGRLADESRARYAWESTIFAAKAGLNHLGVWRDPSMKYFRSADAMLAPLRGEPFGAGSNWSSRPAEFAHLQGPVLDRIAARSMQDIGFVRESSNARRYRAWYWAFDRARPVLGVMFVLGVLAACLSRHRAGLVLAAVWLANAGALSWLGLCGEARYGEPFRAMFVVVGVLGVACAVKMVSTRRGTARAAAIPAVVG